MLLRKAFCPQCEWQFFVVKDFDFRMCSSLIQWKGWSGHGKFPTVNGNLRAKLGLGLRCRDELWVQVDQDQLLMKFRRFRHLEVGIQFGLGWAILPKLPEPPALELLYALSAEVLIDRYNLDEICKLGSSNERQMYVSRCWYNLYTPAPRIQWTALGICLCLFSTSYLVFETIQHQTQHSFLKNTGPSRRPRQNNNEDVHFQ